MPRTVQASGDDPSVSRDGVTDRSINGDASADADLPGFQCEDTGRSGGRGCDAPSAGHGNPSSAHWAGHSAHAVLAVARSQVAAPSAARQTKSSSRAAGSEANNLAIKDAFFAARGGANHIVTTQIEHPATVQACRFLERFVAEVT